MPLPLTCRALLTSALIAGALPAIAAGGTANPQESAKALLTEARRIDRAAVLFALSMERWPYGLTDLTPRFLKRAPAPFESRSGKLEWKVLYPSFPAAWLPDSVTADVCRAFNLQARGDDGIYKAAKPDLAQQCYGRSAPYTLLATYGRGDPAKLQRMLRKAGGRTHAVEESGGGWALAPSAPVRQVPGAAD